MGIDSICILRVRLGLGEELAARPQARNARPTAVEAEANGRLSACFVMVSRLIRKGDEVKAIPLMEMDALAAHRAGRAGEETSWLRGLYMCTYCRSISP